MAQRLQHRPPSLRDRLADASRLCSTVLTATAQRRSAGWLRALGRCLDRTRNKLPDSDNAWLKTGGNVRGSRICSTQACRGSEVLRAVSVMFNLSRVRSETALRTTVQALGPSAVYLTPP